MGEANYKILEQPIADEVKAWLVGFAKLNLSVAVCKPKSGVTPVYWGSCLNTGHAFGSVARARSIQSFKRGKDNSHLR